MARGDYPGVRNDQSDDPHSWNRVLDMLEHGYDDAQGNRTTSTNLSVLAPAIVRRFEGRLTIDQARSLADKVRTSTAAGNRLNTGAPRMPRSELYRSAFIDSGYRVRAYLTVRDTTTNVERTIQWSWDTGRYPTYDQAEAAARRDAANQFPRAKKRTRGDPTHAHEFVRLEIRSLECGTC